MYKTAVALMSVVVLLSAGCAYVKTPILAFSDDGEYLEPSVGNGLVADADGLIPDVPTPVGFEAVATQCTSTFDGRIRTVHYVYQGHAKSGEVQTFYQEVLPRNDWQFIDGQNVASTTTLNYTKGLERLSITARQGYGIATVTIQISAR